MALTHVLSYSIVDYKSKRRAMQIYAPATATLAHMTALSDVLAVTVNAAIGGVIESAQVSLSIPLPGGLRTVAVDDHNINRSARLLWNAANANRGHTMYVPAISDAIADGDDLVFTTELTALISSIAGGTVDVEPSDEYGNDLLTVKSSGTSFLKS